MIIDSLDGIMAAHPTITKISILGRGKGTIDKFSKNCEEKGYKFEEYNVCSSIEDVCKDADIILTANSQAERFEDYP